MEQTAIQPGTPKAAETGIQAELPGFEPRTDAQHKAPKHPVAVALHYLADLRITVALFALSFLLVFWGTLAQTDAGIWTVVRDYFRSYVAMVPMKVLLFNSLDGPGMHVPFPGGKTIGIAMLVNLLAAHTVRFKIAWNRAGIILIHAGIIIMMLGEFVTGEYAIEGSMVIYTGQSSNTVIHPTQSELAIIQTHKDDFKKDEVVTVPARLLHQDAVIENSDLPFKIEVIEYMINSDLRHAPGNQRADQGFGKAHVAKAKPENNGVDPNQKHDIPAVYVKLTDPKGKSLGRWLFTPHFGDAQWITVGNQEYQVMLRFKQTTRDFTMHLNRFDHKLFPGTEKPKDFHSYITLVDPSDKVERAEEIYMNHPLYYRGETYYQSSWMTDVNGKANGTVLQVVRNPGWLLPYISCGVVGFGLLIHFGLTLVRFVQRERRTVR